jgi:hypothetical protein
MIIGVNIIFHMHCTSISRSVYYRIIIIIIIAVVLPEVVIMCVGLIHKEAG